MRNTFNNIRQKAKVKWLLVFSILLNLITCSSSSGQIMRPPGACELSPCVIIYENQNFGGRSKTVGLGESRLSDLNDTASSIRVPKGLVATIFEHADDGGGYGISADLLEDQPDLSKLGLNGKAAYISVFSANRPGFFWARNSIQNGQFVAGHWERDRAGGNPVDTVAVPSPPLPPHTPVGATTIQVNDADFTVTSLGAQTPADDALWNHAETDQMGIIGSDFRGVEEIGSAAFERASNNSAIPDSFDFWLPQKQRNDHRSIVYFKRTLSGTVHEVRMSRIFGTYEDHDVSLDILPSDKYSYFITDAKAREYTDIMSAQWHASGANPYGERSGQSSCDDTPSINEFKFVEAEIQPSGDLHGATNIMLNDMCLQRVGSNICVHGPWIYDRGHCCHGEIHPAEQIWWSVDVGNNKKYNLNLFCDASERFWWRNQMDHGTKLKPWGAPPIRGIFAIAFEAEVGKPGKQFEVSNLDNYNVVGIPNTEKTYNLIYRNSALVSFIPHNNAFKVSFENVGLKPGTTNTVRGFLVIETTVGKVTQIDTSAPRLDPDKVAELVERLVFKKEEGHYMFSILRTDMGRPMLSGPSD